MGLMEVSGCWWWDDCSILIIDEKIDSLRQALVRLFEIGWDLSRRLLVWRCTRVLFWWVLFDCFFRFDYVLAWTNFPLRYNCLHRSGWLWYLHCTIGFLLESLEGIIFRVISTGFVLCHYQSGFPISLGWLTGDLGGVYKDRRVCWFQPPLKLLEWRFPLTKDAESAPSTFCEHHGADHKCGDEWIYEARMVVNEKNKTRY